MLVNKNLTSALLNINFELVFVDTSLPREWTALPRPHCNQSLNTKLRINYRTKICSISLLFLLSRDGISLTVYMFPLLIQRS